jgi:hypothetical protein
MGYEILRYSYNRIVESKIFLLYEFSIVVCDEYKLIESFLFKWIGK